MAHIGLLRNYQTDNADEDIRGATLYGRDDEKLGKIDNVIFDHSSGNIHYVVVDTGGWLTTKKFIVPADRLRPSANHDNDYSSDLTKGQVESFPPYNENELESENQWADYEGRYRAKWETRPVMHRAETDRNITPTTQQLTGNQSSLRASQGLPRQQAAGSQPGGTSEADVRAADSSTARVVPAGTDSVVIDSSAAGLGGRWDTFQARLRQRRKEAVLGCKTCSIGPQSVSASNQAGDQKKAI
jgi:hypothetical protein